jgi:hypothetical protein
LLINVTQPAVLIKEECRRTVGECREDAGAVAKAVIRPMELMMRPGETTKHAMARPASEIDASAFGQKLSDYQNL